MRVWIKRDKDLGAGPETAHFLFERDMEQNLAELDRRIEELKSASSPEERRWAIRQITCSRNKIEATTSKFSKYFFNLLFR